MSSALRYAYRRNVLTLKAAGEDIVFPGRIVLVVAFERSLAVLVEPDRRHGGENVYGIGLDGTILWQIPRLSYPSQAGPYVGMARRGDDLAAWNTQGTTLTLRPVTGRLRDVQASAPAAAERPQLPGAAFARERGAGRRLS